MNTEDFVIKKFNLRVGRLQFVEIPNMTRNDLALLFGELKFNKGAEIGVESGAYSEILCKSNPNLTLSSIDPYSPGAYEADINGIDYRDEHFKGMYERAKKALSPFNANLIRKGSMDAISQFPNESLDFVYIDGNHSYVNVAQDIHEWSKKVKKQGIVAGHDYAFFPSAKQNHVKYVVQTYTKAYGIKPVFIVGAEAVGVPGVARDPFRSWFYIKK